MRCSAIPLSISAFLLAASFNVHSASAQTRFNRVTEIEPRAYEVFEVELSAEDQKKASENPEAFFRELLTANKIPINALVLDARIRTGQKISPRKKVYHCKAPPSCVSESIIIEEIK